MEAANANDFLQKPKKEKLKNTISVKKAQQKEQNKSNATKQKVKEFKRQINTKRFIVEKTRSDSLYDVDLFLYLFIRHTSSSLQSRCTDQIHGLRSRQVEQPLTWVISGVGSNVRLCLCLKSNLIITNNISLSCLALLIIRLLMLQLFFKINVKITF